MEDLPPLDPITRLTPSIIRILGGNPSKYTLQGTNTYLLGRGPRRILLDTGEGKPAWRESLARALADEQGVRVDRILLSHWHHDHIGGVRDALSLEGCAGARVFKSRRDEGGKHVADGHPVDFSLERDLGVEGSGGRGEVGDIEDGMVFETEGVKLTAVYSPGHTEDHMAFLLEEEDGAGAMFTGDNVLGHGTAVFEDLAKYMASLDGMQQGYSDLAKATSSTAVQAAYPGHGAVIADGPAKIKEYIAHRKEREQQVLAVLRQDAPQKDGGEGWRSMSIVKIIYKDYPEHLHQPAEGSVLHILRKMESDGRVRHDKSSGTWSLTEKAAL